MHEIRRPLNRKYLFVARDPGDLPLKYRGNAQEQNPGTRAAKGRSDFGSTLVSTMIGWSKEMIFKLKKKAAVSEITPDLW